MIARRPNRLLIVDNEPEVLEILEEVLAGEGVEVVVEQRPSRALERLREGAFTALITDLNMPEVHGLRLLEQALEAQPTLRTMVLTGYPSADSAARCRALGVVDYVRKPFDFEELRASVRVLCSPSSREDGGRVSS